MGGPGRPGPDDLGGRGEVRLTTPFSKNRSRSSPIIQANVAPRAANRNDRVRWVNSRPSRFTLFTRTGKWSGVRHFAWWDNRLRRAACRRLDFSVGRWLIRRTCRLSAIASVTAPASESSPPENITTSPTTPSNGVAL